MKDGLIFEKEGPVYYKHGRTYHAGVIRVDGDIYYISSRGRAIKGRHVVHGEMTNGILKRGTYTFGEDYKLIPGSYVPPKKQKKFSLRKWKKWAPGVSVFLLACLVTLIAVNGKRLAADPYEPQSSANMTQEKLEQTANFERPTVHLPTFENKVLLCSPAAKQVYDNQTTVENAVEAGTAYRPMNFEYDFTDSEGVLTVTEAGSPMNSRSFLLEPKYTAIAIDNLKTGTNYEYQVTVDGEVYDGTFETEKSTRFVSIDGIVNTRDIGGYETADGRTVRQGLLIRGSEMDGLAVPSFFVSEETVQEVQETFGFVYDFDLRGGSVYTGVYQSRLGENVGHYFYGAPQYGEIFNRIYQPALREIFTDLADPSKYPMYMHCTYGADRTGTIVFLLQGVLNMSEEDMLREYQLTGFYSRAYRNAEKLEIVVNGLQAFAGDTLQEKIVSFLKEAVGITEDQLQSIRDIFLA